MVNFSSYQNQIPEYIYSPMCLNQVHFLKFLLLVLYHLIHYKLPLTYNQNHHNKLFLKFQTLLNYLVKINQYKNHFAPQVEAASLNYQTTFLIYLHSIHH